MRQITKSRGKSALAIVRQFFPNVTHVTDGKRSATVEVTSKDLAASKKKDHKECAMAVACKRAKHLDGVIISVGTAYLIKSKKATRYMVPERVAREVVSFDRSGQFAAGEYKLQAPPATRRLGTVSGGGRHTDKGKRKQLRRHLTQGIRSVLGSKVAE